MQRLAGRQPREKMPQGKLFRRRGVPTDHVPPAGTCRMLGGIQSHSVTVETTEPATLPSRASPLPSSRHAASRHFPCSLAAASRPKRRGTAGSVCQGLRGRSLRTFTTPTGAARVGSRVPLIHVFAPATRTLRVVFSPRKLYFGHSRCSAISHPSFKTSFTHPGSHPPQEEAPPGFQNQSKNLHSKTLPFSTLSPV